MCEPWVRDKLSFEQTFLTNKKKEFFVSFALFEADFYKVAVQCRAYSLFHFMCERSRKYTSTSVLSWTLPALWQGRWKLAARSYSFCYVRTSSETEKDFPLCAILFFYVKVNCALSLLTGSARPIARKRSSSWSRGASRRRENATRGQWTSPPKWRSTSSRYPVGACRNFPYAAMKGRSSTPFHRDLNGLLDEWMDANGSTLYNRW